MNEKAFERLSASASNVMTKWLDKEDALGAMVERIFNHSHQISCVQE